MPMQSTNIKMTFYHLINITHTNYNTKQYKLIMGPLNVGCLIGYFPVPVFLVNSANRVGRRLCFCPCQSISRKIIDGLGQN